jgi:hypothetical protein
LNCRRGENAAGDGVVGAALVWSGPAVDVGGAVLVWSRPAVGVAEPVAGVVHPAATRTSKRAKTRRTELRLHVRFADPLAARGLHSATRRLDAGTYAVFQPSIDLVTCSIQERTLPQELV